MRKIFIALLLCASVFALSGISFAYQNRIAVDDDYSDDDSGDYSDDDSGDYSDDDSGDYSDDDSGDYSDDDSGDYSDDDSGDYSDDDSGDYSDDDSGDYSDDDTSDYSEDDSGDNSGYSASGSEKTMWDYFKENVDRLKKHPNSDAAKNGYKYDSAIVGEWMAYQAVKGEYKVMINYFRFNSDGTGRFEQTPIVLMKNKTVKIDLTATLASDFEWGIEVVYGDDKRAVTLITMIFGDGSLIDVYYAYDTGGMLGFIYYDRYNQTTTGQLSIFYPKSKVQKGWNSGGDQEVIRKALADAYDRDSAPMSDMEFGTLWYMNQMQHLTMMNIINNFN